MKKNVRGSEIHSPQSCTPPQHSCYYLPPPGPHTLFHSFIQVAVTIQPGIPGLLTGKGTQPWVLLSSQLSHHLQHVGQL